MVLSHPQICINDVPINGEDLEGVYVMLYFESWMVLVVIYVSDAAVRFGPVHTKNFRTLDWT